MTVVGAATAAAMAAAACGCTIGFADGQESKGK